MPFSAMIRPALIICAVSLMHSPAGAQFPAWRKQLDGQGLSIGINPLNPNTIFAQGNDDRLQVSHDRGATWSSLSPTLPSQLREILIHPNDSLTMFVADFSDGLRKSTDGGASWSVVISPYGIDGESFTYDPSHPDTMYAGNYSDASIYRSTDRGSSWTLQGHAGSGVMCGLTVRPDSANILYAGTGSGRISRSTDAGHTWVQVKSGGSSEIPKFVINPSDPLVGYATGYEGTPSAEGVWKTTNGGVSWFLTSLNGVSVWSLDLDRNHPDTLFAGSFSEYAAGVYRSTDAGATWMLLSRGFVPYNSMWNLKVDQQDSPAVYVGVTNGDFGANGVFALGNATAGIEGYVRDSLNGNIISTGSVQAEPSGPGVSLDQSGGSFFFYKFDGDSLLSRTFDVTINSILFEQSVVTLVPDSILRQDISVRPGSVAGTVYNDLNHNGVRDVGENGLQGSSVLLAGPAGATLVSDSGGHYMFSDLFPGAYTVSHPPPFGWITTAPSGPYSITVDLTHKTMSGMDFGDRRAHAVLSLAPGPFTDSTSGSAVVTATFDTAINPASFNDTASWIVSGSVSGRHRGTFSYSAGNTVATFVPSEPFRRGELVTSDITKNIRTAAGDAVVPSVTQFNVASAPAVGSFAPKVDYAVGSTPLAVATGDLDHDGFADIVTANQGGNSVTVLRNNGDGTFGSGATYATGISPRALALADVDRDGSLDIIVADNGAKAISVLRNNGDGTFASNVDYWAGSYPFSLATTDVDGDGYPDVIVSNFSVDSISVLLNSGTGTFPSISNYPSGPSPWIITAADINGDGGPDLLVANSTATSLVSTLLNSGGGSVLPGLSYAAGSFARALSVADVTGDGYPDLMIVNASSNSITIYRNDGHGGLGMREDVPTGSSPWEIATGDLDGDGLMDLVVAESGTDSISVFKNLGGGSFARSDQLVGTGPRAVAIADLTNDGRPDIVVANSASNTVSVIVNATIVSSSVNNGWNMLSLPLRASGSSRSRLFPASVSSAFTFSGGYVATDSITFGPGYWLKFGADSVVPIFGDPVAVETLEVEGRWNLIGSISVPVDAASVSSVPPGIVTSSYFGYAGTYVTVDTLLPGKAYWVRASQPGALVLASSQASAVKQERGGRVPDGYGWIEVRDEAARRMRLYFSGALPDTESLDQFDLPPAPPAGSFDVRYSTNRYVAGAVSGREAEVPVIVSAAQYPLLIRWDLTHEPASAWLRMGGKKVPIAGSGSVQMQSPVSTLSLVISPSGPLPTSYTLEENYPNPFNPVTTIAYALPANSLVTLNVYDVLGQEVATLVNSSQAAGYHSVRWAGGNSPSGIYYYRLEARSNDGADKAFVQVRKMILLK